MRYVRYIAPVESVSGKWAQQNVTAGDQNLPSNTPRTLFISQRRDNLFGFKAYFAIKSANRSTPVTEGEILARARFTQVAKAVTAAYKDTTKFDAYRAQWAAAGKTVTLRKFIWDAEAANIES